MIIDSSTIQMNSGHFYAQSTETTKTIYGQSQSGYDTYQSTQSFLQSYGQYQGSLQSNTALQQYDEFVKSNQATQQENPLMSDLYTNFGNTNIKLTDIRSTLEDFRKQLIERLERFMEQIREQLLGRGNRQVQYQSTELSIVDLTQTSQPGSLWKIQTTQSVKQTEHETSCFESVGHVQTADGRSISFNISIEMSRSFIQECSQMNEQTQYILTDPLVIQLDDAPDTITDQKWFFDLDGDGIQEEISQLAKGNAFLAFDANENGKIDDGSELFGTKSGNGFSDLSKYDEDGNGWIDENDTIFTKLKVWTKDASGNNKLMDLKSADIGAIYLEYANTAFSHKDAENETLAVTKQTGIYLKESTGMTGTIKQIDFATEKTA